MRNIWPATAITEAESGYDHHRLLYRIDKSRKDKGHPFRQEIVPKPGNGNESVPETPIYHPIRSAPVATSACGKGGSRKLSSDSKPGSFDSGCALYLLSTLQTQSSELSLMQSSINSPTQSSSGGMNFDAVNEYSYSGKAKDKTNGSVFVLDANTTNLHCNGMLQMGQNGLVENENSLTLPFFWE